MLEIKKKRTLGRTGFEISEIGFGAWAIGGSAYGEVEEKKAKEAVKTYLEAGGNFIDTAEVYGESEKILGKVLEETEMTEEIFIASKSHNCESRENITRIREDLENALQSLNRDYIDLYYLHNPPSDTELRERVLEEFEKFKKEGKIRAIGASIKGADVTDKTVELCNQYIDTGKVDVIQLVYSIFRQKNAEIFDKAQDNNIGLVARTALESGFLTGKYKPGHEFKDHRGRWQGEKLENILKEVEKLKEEVVKPPYESLSQVAIRFSLRPEEISTVIVGAKSKSQTEENISVSHLPPLDEQMISNLKDKYRGKTELFNTG